MLGHREGRAMTGQIIHSGSICIAWLLRSKQSHKAAAKLYSEIHLNCLHCESLDPNHLRTTDRETSLDHIFVLLFFKKLIARGSISTWLLHKDIFIAILPLIFLYYDNLSCFLMNSLVVYPSSGACCLKTKDSRVERNQLIQVLILP